MVAMTTTGMMPQQEEGMLNFMFCYSASDIRWSLVKLLLLVYRVLCMNIIYNCGSIPEYLACFSNDCYFTILRALRIANS